MKRVLITLAGIFSLAALLLTVSSCEKDEPEEQAPATFAPLYQTSKFTCYNDGLMTEDPSLSGEIIKLEDLPDIDIYFSRNEASRSDSPYDYKSILTDSGEYLLTLYSSVIPEGDGYLLKYSIDGGEEFGFHIGKEDFVTRSWGQRTADCLADVYSKKGWLSVWASVQSAFLPETAAAFAAACAIINIKK